MSQQQCKQKCKSEWSHFQVFLPQTPFLEKFITLQKAFTIILALSGLEKNLNYSLFFEQAAHVFACLGPLFGHLSYRSSQKMTCFDLPIRQVNLKSYMYLPRKKICLYWTTSRSMQRKLRPIARGQWILLLDQCFLFLTCLMGKWCFLGKFKLQKVCNQSC